MKYVRLFIFAALILLVNASVLAYDFEVDGICYNIKTSTEPYEVAVAKKDYPNNYSIEEVVIPESVSYGGITYSVVEIASGAFFYCPSLKSITIGNRVTKIGDLAFAYCSALDSVFIGRAVNNIYTNIFKDCSGLTSIVVDLENTTYDSRDNCNGIVVTETNTFFLGCKTSTIPNSITGIGDEAFYECDGLTTINIPNSVISIGRSSFTRCVGLTEVSLPHVQTIARGAFRLCENLTSVDLGSALITIENEAFYRCSNLQSIFIPNSVTSIGDRAFEGCTSLRSINIPNSISVIENGTFMGCSGLLNVDIPNSITSIGSHAFSGCENLAMIYIPSSVNSIGLWAFLGCVNLKSLSVDVNNVVYDSRQNCNAIIETETNTLIRGCNNSFIPASVQVIGVGAFSGCSGLTTVSLPDGCYAIYLEAFYGCSRLSAISIPKQVVNIGRNAFSETAMFYDNSYWENNAFYIDDCLLEISRDSGFGSVIGDYIIRDGTRLVADKTFQLSSDLISIHIPNSVTEIGSGAFSNCENLTSIILKATVPPSLGYHYHYGNSNISVYIPCGSHEAYSNDQNWSSLGSIVESDMNSPYMISVRSDNEELGSVRITQWADCETKKSTVLAEPKDEHLFVHWILNGQVVSTDNPYTFTVDNDVELVAHFSSTGVGEDAANRMILSPNPASDRVKIECENMRQIEICSLDGRKIASYHPMNSSYEMDLSSLKSGIYLICVQVKEGLVLTRKMVKE